MIINKDTLYKISDIYDKTISSFNSVLIGQEKVKKVVASSLLCDRNARMLFTGSTGIGKTTLANFLASSFNAERISVNSDLLPSDIHEQLIDKPDLQLLQVDEFNRASGKVQSSFIELFAENQMTVMGKKYTFNDFYVIATQNNVDIAGIFNVPQAIYDRFDVSISFDTLSSEEMRMILFTDFKPLYVEYIDFADIEFTKLAVDSFKMKKEDMDLLMKIFNIINAMVYNDRNLFSGPNIRAHAFAIKLAKFNALADGRDYIKPCDLADFINYLYMHRIDQNVKILHDGEIQERFYDARNNILSLRR